MASTRKCHDGPFSHPSSPVFSVAISVPMRRCAHHAASHLKSSCVDSNQEHGYFRVSVKCGWGIFGPSITDQRRGHRNLVDRLKTRVCCLTNFRREFQFLMTAGKCVGSVENRHLSSRMILCGAWGGQVGELHEQFFKRN